MKKSIFSSLDKIFARYTLYEKRKKRKIKNKIFTLKFSAFRSERELFRVYAIVF
jgi:hypothetical protein